MTEEESKTKWCPYARVFIPLQDKKTTDWCGVTAANRVCLSETIQTVNPNEERSNPLSARCIGSACMAWRTHEVSVPNRHDASTHRETRGYCGLAGKP